MVILSFLHRLEYILFKVNDLNRNWYFTKDLGQIYNLQSRSLNYVICSGNLSIKLMKYYFKVDQKPVP